MQSAICVPSFKYPSTVSSEFLLKFQWGDFVDIETAQNSTTKLDEAKDFLREFLSEGEKPQTAVMNAADSLGIAKRTLDKAKAELGIKSFKTQNQWLWKIKDCKNVKIL